MPIRLQRRDSEGSDKHDDHSHTDDATQENDTKADEAHKVKALEALKAKSLEELCKALDAFRYKPRPLSQSQSSTPSK